MRSTARWLTTFGFAVVIALLVAAHTSRHAVAAAQTRKPVVITRLYTGPDGLTHAEDMEIPLTGDAVNEISEMFKITGAEIHRTPPGKVNDWHTAPRRQ